MIYLRLACIVNIRFFWSIFHSLIFICFDRKLFSLSFFFGNVNCSVRRDTGFQACLIETMYNKAKRYRRDVHQWAARLTTDCLTLTCTHISSNSSSSFGIKSVCDTSVPLWDTWPQCSLWDSYVAIRLRDSQLLFNYYLNFASFFILSFRSWCQLSSSQIRYRFCNQFLYYNHLSS